MPADLFEELLSRLVGLACSISTDYFAKFIAFTVVCLQFEGLGLQHGVTSADGYPQGACPYIKSEDELLFHHILRI